MASFLRHCLSLHCCKGGQAQMEIFAEEEEAECSSLMSDRANSYYSMEQPECCFRDGKNVKWKTHAVTHFLQPWTHTYSHTHESKQFLMASWRHYGTFGMLRCDMCGLKCQGDWGEEKLTKVQKRHSSQMQWQTRKENQSQIFPHSYVKSCPIPFVMKHNFQKWISIHIFCTFTSFVLVKMKPWK